MVTKPPNPQTLDAPDRQRLHACRTWLSALGKRSRLRALHSVQGGSWKVVPSTWLMAAWQRLLLSNEGKWCFILGLNNSGTTLLSRLLAKHRRVRSLPQEGQVLTRALARPWAHGVQRIWSEKEEVFRLTDADDGKSAQRAVHDWGFYYVRQRGNILLEKSPPNSIRSRWLQKFFSPAYFLAMFRDPFAVAEGIRRREGYDIERAAEHWCRANQILLRDMPHLERVLPIRYEDFCQHPEGIFRTIEDFLELPHQPWPDIVRGVAAHSIEGRTGGIRNFNPASISRLSEEDRRRVREKTASVADALGYKL